MSGHSKWANIKHKKEKTDAQKAKVFTKIGKEMAIAIRAGGPDPNSNSKLRELIAKAKANNVPLTGGSGCKFAPQLLELKEEIAAGNVGDYSFYEKLGITPTSETIKKTKNGDEVNYQEVLMILYHMIQFQ